MTFSWLILKRKGGKKTIPLTETKKEREEENRKDNRKKGKWGRKAPNCQEFDVRKLCGESELK